MNAKDQRRQFLKNGYGLTAGDAIECQREPLERWRHTHLSSIRLTVADTKAASALVAAVLAAVEDEPGIVLVATNKTDLLLLFRMGPSYHNDGKQKAFPFIYRDGSGQFTAAVETAVTVSDWTWVDNLSPLNTRRDELAPLYPDTAQRASEAVGTFLRENGGRWGTQLEIPKTPGELRLEQTMRERAARRAAGITDETKAEDADTLLIAAHRNLRATDGPIGVLVHEARRRVDARKAAACAETARLKQEEKEQKARFKAMAEHVEAEAV